MRIDLARPLPREFVVEARSVMALYPNVGVPVVMAIGGVERTFTVGGKATDVRLPFKLDADASAIEIRIPRPVSPAEIGLNADLRKLGIGFESLAVKPRD
jgi:hypothetical protein